MQARFLTKTIDYDGAQLCSGWVASQTGLTGDAAVAFLGAAKVQAEHMVDLEDLADQAWIYSEQMLHFIIEHGAMPLPQAIAHQRLFIATMAEELQRARPELRLTRSGNDLYDGEAKLSVSIATTSPVSSLIHAGINVVSDNTPVHTKGLRDYDIAPRPFAEHLLQRYTDEVAGILHAAGKVRPVR